MIKAVIGSPAGPAMAGLVFAMALNLHQVLNRLTFESIPSVFCPFVEFEINTNLFLLFIRCL